MSQVINGLPISDKLLNMSFNRWVQQDKDPKVEPADFSKPQEDEKPQQEEVKHSETLIETMVSIKSDIKFMDNNTLNQEKTATNISSQIRNIIYNLQNKYSGGSIIEANGITSVRFKKPSSALKFAEEALKDIETYQEEVSGDSLLMRDCIAVIAYKPDEEPNLSLYLSDMFEHIYNNEIVVSKEIKDSLPSDGYEWDFLGEKPFKNMGINESLYKLLA